MDFIEVKRPILIKVIITEQFKNQIINESKEAIANIEKNLEQLKNVSPALMPEEVKKQTESLNGLKEEFLQKIKDFETVQLGQELPFRNIEGMAQVKVGDNLLEKITMTEVVIKDWVVQEIRRI